MPNSPRTTRWSRPALNALELLHAAGWRWAAVAVHVSAVDGVERTPKACRRKAQEIRITSHAGKSWRATEQALLEDLYDLMVLDYTAAEIAEALYAQHGVRRAERWVTRTARQEHPSTYAAWYKRRADRMTRLKRQRRAA